MFKSLGKLFSNIFKDILGTVLMVALAIITGGALLSIAPAWMAAFSATQVYGFAVGAALVVQASGSEFLKKLFIIACFAVISYIGFLHLTTPGGLALTGPGMNYLLVKFLTLLAKYPLWMAGGSLLVAWTLWNSAESGDSFVEALGETIVEMVDSGILIASVIGGALATSSGNVISAFLSSPVGMGVAAVAIYYVFFRDRGESDSIIITQDENRRKRVMKDESDNDADVDWSSSNLVAI